MATNEMEDVLGTGTVLKQVLSPGDQPGDTDMEAPRKFFALIDIDTKLAGSDQFIESECHTDFLLSVDADLFSGAHLVLPLMNINEKARFIFDSKFAYGSLGNPPHIPPDSKLECVITLKSRVPHQEFVENHLYDEDLLKLTERLALANRKRERGNFWFSRSDLPNAITCYKSALLLINDAVGETESLRLIGMKPGSTKVASDKGKVSCFDDFTKLEIVKCLIITRNNLAQSYINVQELKKASENILKVLKLDPTNLKALFRRATIQSQIGSSSDAIKTLHKLLKLDPCNKPAQQLLGKVKERARIESERERGMYRRMFGTKNLSQT